MWIILACIFFFRYFLKILMLLMRGPQPEDLPTETKEEKPGQLRILAALPPPTDDSGSIHSNSIEKDDATNQSVYLDNTISYFGYFVQNQNN